MGLSPNAKRIILAAFGLVVLVALASLFAPRQQGTGTTASPSSSPVAAGTSSPTPTPVDSTPTPTPTSVPVSDRPIYSGIDNLLSHGVTAPQTDDLKWAFYQYAKSTNHASSISISNVAVQPYNPKVGTQDITFAAAFDNTVYSARLTYVNYQTMRVVLTNSAGKAVYDSGNVSGKSL